MKRHLSFVAALGLCFFASITAAYAQVRADPGGIAIGGSVTGSTVIIGIPQEKVDSEIEVTRTHFAYHIYTSTAESVVENVAGRVEEYQVARTTLAWHPHHVAAGRASDRGQPAPALGLV